MSEASKLTGISTSALSKVENNQMQLTYDKLMGLASGLGVDISELFALEKHPDRFIGRRSIDQPGEGAVVATQHYHYRYLSAELSSKGMIPTIGEVHARTMKEFGPLLSHLGEEFIYVLEGEIEFHCDSYAPTILKTGAALYFDARMGHAYLKASEAPARILTVCTSPDSSSSPGL